MFLLVGRWTRRSFSVALRSRSLWLYGVVLSVLGGEPLRAALFLNEGGAGNLEAWLGEVSPDTLLALMEAVVVSTVLLWGISVLAGNWALAALLAGGRERLEGRGVSFRQAGAGGWSHFWSILAIGLLTGVAAVLLLAPLGAAGAAALLTHETAFLAVSWLWVPFAASGLVAVGLWSTVAQVHAVVEGAGPVRSLLAAAGLLNRRRGELLALWFINDVAAGCGGGCLLFGLAGTVAAPALLGLLLAPGDALVPALPGAVALLLASLASGAVQVFRRTLWLVAYQDLARDGRRA